MPCWDGPIYNTEQLATKTMVVPLRDINELYLIFPIPDQADYYKSKVKIFKNNAFNFTTNIQFLYQPTWFLGNIFQHEEPNSLLGILKNKGWCYDLFAGRHKEARGIDLFQIRICLSKKGFNYVDDIIKLIFQVSLLKYICI